MVFLKKLFAFGVVLLLATTAFAQDEQLLQAFANSYTAEKNKEYKKAADFLRKVYMADSYELNLRLGWLTYQAGQLSESVQYYQKAVALKPYAVEPRLGLAYPLWAQGRWDELAALYGKVLEIDPQNCFANYRMGLLLYNKAQYDKATPYLERVVNLYPFDYDGLLLLAWNNLKLQRHKEARVLFGKVLLYNPGDASALEGLQLLK